MPWTDHSKPASKPGPWEDPQEGAPDAPASEPDKGVKAPIRHDGAKRGLQRPEAGGPRFSARSGDRPKAPPIRGPSLDELGRALHGRIAGVASSPAGRRARLAILPLGCAVLLAGWLASGVRVIEPDEVGVVTRFGVFAALLGPGLHYRLPAPLERVRRLDPSAPQEFTIGSDGRGLQTLTRDGAPLTLTIAVQWRISDPLRYAFGSPAPIATLETATESAVREVVGLHDLPELVGDRSALSDAASVRVQALLDRYKVGVEVSGLQIRDATPPEPAQDGFRDLAAASADAAEATREADIYRARVLADARGEAASGLHEAEAVRDREVAEARGEATRFALVDQAYRSAPDLTRERLYTETMTRVLHDADKVVVPSARGAAISLPPELLRPKAEGRRSAAQTVPSKQDGSP